MTFKLSELQVTLPVSNTTFDFTDPAINNDWKGAIFFGGQPTVNITNTANADMFIGACDSAGRNVGYAQNCPDATSGANPRSGVSATNCIHHLAVTGGTNLLGAYSSTLSNGVRMALSSNDGIAHKCNAVLFSGADVEFACSSQHFLSTDTSIAFAHNLTGTPAAAIVISLGNGTTLGNFGNHSFSIGVYDGANSSGFGGVMSFGVNPTNVAARCGTADMGHWIVGSPADQTNWTISSVGPTNLTIARGNNGGTAANVIVIAWRNLVSTAAAAAYVDTTPTATGSHVIRTGMSVAPQLWFSLTTRLTATTFTNSDAAGSWGFNAAVNNNGTTQQGSIAAVHKYNVSGSSVDKTQITNSQACTTLDSTGAVTFTSTVQSWNADGATENVGTAGASAFERINLLFGIQPASQSSFVPLGPGVSPVAQTQFETFPFSNANALQPYFPPPGSNAPLLSLIWGPGNSPNPQTQFERFPFSTLPPPISITIGGILASNSTLYGVLGLATLPTAQALGQPSPGVQPYADSQFRMFPFSNSAANTTSFAQGLLQSNSLFYGTLIGTGALGAIMPPNSTFFGFLTPITLGQIAGLWQSNSTVYANLTGIGNIAGLSLSNSLLSALKIGSGFQPLVPNTPVLDVRTDTGYEPWSVRPGKTIG